MANVEIYTEDGKYSIPKEELEKYRVPERKGGKDTEVAGYTQSFDPSALRPNTTVALKIGTRPIVRSGGRMIISEETVVPPP
jgi:hypothetical protein